VDYGGNQKVKKRIELTVNGEKHQLEVDPRETLIKVIREDLALTGTKSGCEMGDCGSCTVLMDGLPVNSCLVLALEADGSEIITIEGLGEGEKSLHPLQKSFIENGAIQCGFCTPGMIMTAKALLDANPNPTESDVRTSIAGNYCRCTGYDQIVKSILSASE
jgi:carbon-monoxide dehydrogenase small subunit